MKKMNWCGVCGKNISDEEYKEDLKNLENTPNNKCKDCRETEKYCLDFDIWLYPDQLGIDRILNVFRDCSVGDDESQWCLEINEYELPQNWREIVTQDRGEDGKPSIHDIMKEI